MYKLTEIIQHYKSEIRELTSVVEDVEGNCRTILNPNKDSGLLYATNNFEVKYANWEDNTELVIGRVEQQTPSGKRNWVRRMV